MDKCIKMPLLGQKIHVGMTYDYGDDKFFPADPSVKRTQLETVTLNDPVLVEVINLQSLYQIANSMNLEGIFKLNILHELINDQPQHPLLNDNRESIRVIKAAIRLNLITRTDKLTLQDSATIAEKVENGRWVVTEIQQALELFIVLEKTVASNEKVEQTRRELLDVASKISKGHEIASDLKGLSVEVRGDIGHCKWSISTTGSKSIFEWSSELLQTNKELATPKLAVLRWIKKSTDTALQKVAIVDADMQQVENILRCFDEFRDLKWRLAALVSSVACKSVAFKWIQQDLRTISDLLNQEQKLLTQQVLDATKKHRKSFPDKFDIGEIVCHYKQKVPNSWWPKKEQEINIMNDWLNMLSPVEFCPSFESVEEKFGDCITLYSLQINIKAVQDPLISALLSRAPIDISGNKWWFDSETEISLGKLIKNFVDLAENVKSDASKKFVFGCFDKENCAVIECVCYENGEPRHFFPPAAPKILHIEEITANSVKLIWEMPEMDQVITHFMCAYRLRDPDSDAIRWHERRTSGLDRNITFHNLCSDCEYDFKVASVSDVGSSKYVELRGAVQTLIAEITVPEKASIPFLHSDSTRILLDLIMQESDQITTTDPNVYQVKGERVFSDDKENIYRYVYGKKSTVVPMEKVILILGITGGGKSTLIDAIFNFVCGVKFEDDFRLKVTKNVPKGPGHSITDSIDIYTVYLEVEDCSQYVLTIVDTPGFLDTAGYERDEQLQLKLRQLFTNRGPGGIDHIDAVGIVTPSSQGRITVAQRYIFDCVTKVFAKDIEDNIFILCTFADDKKPEVLDALTLAELPFKKYFQFNNCTLFQKKTDNTVFTTEFWEMGQKGISQFLEELRNIIPQSIFLSKAVLDERFQLEMDMSGLILQMNSGLGKMQEIRETKAVVAAHRTEIDQNKNFDVTVHVPAVIKEKHVGILKRIFFGSPLNCTVCMITCGREWAYWKGRFENCNVCPGKCEWEKHECQTYQTTVTMQKITRTIDEMKLKYGLAVDELGQAERLLESLNTFLRLIQDMVASLIKDMHHSIKKLNDIALYPNVNSSPEFVELLIQSEEQEHKSGYQERIKTLLIVKQRAAVLESIAHNAYEGLVGDEKAFFDLPPRQNLDTFYPKDIIEDTSNEDGELKRLFNPAQQLR